MTREEMLSYFEEKRNRCIELYKFCEDNDMHDRACGYISRLCELDDIIEEIFGIRYFGDEKTRVDNMLWK